MNKDVLLNLPEQPGCYLMKDRNNCVIYVGKAKNLNKRVRSYFTKTYNLKTQKLVSEIYNIDYILTNSNKESFILENNLIKKYTPRYNILLKDDKTYPYICLTKEAYPRLFITRKKDNTNKFFGPYPSVSSARDFLDLLQESFPIRKCKNLPKKPCIYLHLNQCLAPCIYKDISYSDIVNNISNILNGNIKDLINILEEKMLFHSKLLEFEKAKFYLEKINNIKKSVEKQIFSNLSNEKIDYIGIYYDDNYISIYILMQRNGEVIMHYDSIFSITLSYINTLNDFLREYYSNYDIPKYIYINETLDNTFLENKILIPKKGTKKELLSLASKNAKDNLINKFYLKKALSERKKDVLFELSKLINIKYPRRIEAFDNSSICGLNNVSAMVCFIDGIKNKKEFRKYHFKDYNFQNDYLFMYELIKRRFKKVIEENLDLCDLIIVDGGKIQVNACIKALNELNLDINVCGIVKDDNHKARELFYNNTTYNIDKSSDLYLFLLEVSECVHNEAISFFRNTFSKSIYKSSLDNIKGLGKKTKEKLIKEFGTIENIKKASDSDFKRLNISKKIIDSIKNL